jgi:hypothetical protein
MTTSNTSAVEALRALSARLYTTSGPHLSGWRVVMGFETLDEAQAAHDALANAPAILASLSQGDGHAVSANLREILSNSLAFIRLKYGNRDDGANVLMSQISTVLDQGDGIDPAALPRCDKLDGSTLRIVPSYTEAGQFCEANCLTVTDGEHTAIYVPHRVVQNPDQGDSHASDCAGPSPASDTVNAGLLEALKEFVAWSMCGRDRMDHDGRRKWRQAYHTLYTFISAAEGDPAAPEKEDGHASDCSTCGDWGTGCPTCNAPIPAPAWSELVSEALAIKGHADNVAEHGCTKSEAKRLAEQTATIIRRLTTALASLSAPVPAPAWSEEQIEGAARDVCDALYLEPDERASNQTMRGDDKPTWKVVADTLRSASLNATPPADYEEGWLIELSAPDGPRWLVLGDRWSFTKDAFTALRFSRKRDAESFIAANLKDAPGQLQATKHSWGFRTPQAQGHGAGAGWRDIATAPDDGTWFVAYQDGEAYPCEWRTEEPDEGPLREGWWDHFNQSFEEPTHWSPVLSPALTEEAGVRREALLAIIEKHEQGEEHNEGASDVDCPVCLLLEDLRALLSPAAKGQRDA